MARIFQERIFEGFMNVAIDNFNQRNPHKVSLYVPSPQKEKKLGYDVKFGDMLFIQYKTLEESKSKKYSIDLDINQQNILRKLETANPCSVFYVFPYHEDFDVLRADYYRGRWCRGTYLLKNAIFIPLYNIKTQIKQFTFDFNKGECSLDSSTTNRFNFFDWLFSRKGWGYRVGYARIYENMMYAGFCPCSKCNDNPGNPSIGNILNQCKNLINIITDCDSNITGLEERLSKLENLSFNSIENGESKEVELDEKESEKLATLTEIISYLQYILSEYFDITLVSPIRKIYK